MTVPPPPLWRRVERCSDLSCPPGPAPNEIFMRKARRRTRAHPSDAVACSKVTRWGSQQNAVAVGLEAQPNGVRLSCGALKKNSFLNLRAPAASSAC